MDILQWGSTPYLALLVSVLIPFCILMVFWRRTAIAVSPSVPTGVTRKARHVILVGRLMSIAAVLLAVLTIQGTWLPTRVSESWAAFLVPIGIAILSTGIAAVLLPGYRRAGHGGAKQVDIHPRSLWTFGEARWYVAWITAAALLISTVVLAGSASSADGDGRFTILTVDVGSAMLVSSFPGWYYGVPVLLGIGLLAVTTLIVLKAISLPSMPPTDGEARADVGLRRLAARTILVLGCGSMTLTLGWMLLSVGEGARAAASLPGGTLGNITIGTPLAANDLAVTASGLFCQGLGIALMLLPLFAKGPRSSVMASATSTNDHGEAAPATLNV